MSSVAIPVQVALVTAVFLVGCGHYEDRAFFAKEHGIGVADPEPDKDGTWWLAIEHETAIQHSGQFVQRWDAEVKGDTITVRALVVGAGRITNWWYGPPESGAHIDVLREDLYHVVYLDAGGQGWPLANVTARRQDIMPPKRWQWSNVRHNPPLNPSGAKNAPTG